MFLLLKLALIFVQSARNECFAKLRETYHHRYVEPEKLESFHKLYIAPENNEYEAQIQIDVKKRELTTDVIE